MAPAAPTFTLAVDPALDAVTITLQIPAGATQLFLSRSGPSDALAYVRGANPFAVTPGTTVFRDFEAPIGVPLTYFAQLADDTGAQSPTTQHGITVPTKGCDDTWLNDIAAPSNTQRVVIERLDELDYEAANGVHFVLNRRTPIVTSDIARTPHFELNFLTETEDQRLRARAALGNGVPNLIRTPPENGIASVYFVVTDWKEQRIVNMATLPDRRFVLTCVQVDRPDPILYVPLFISTYAGIRDAYTDYAALKASRATYDDVLHDPAGAHAADLVPWPPADV